MSGRTKVLLVCAVSLGASILRLSAQEVGGDTITGKVHQIEKVTVTARRSPNKVTSAVPIQTMSRQDISQLGIQNMADAVRRFAGANVKDYGGIGGLKTVSIRNMGAAHTAVSYDGVAVSNCQADRYRAFFAGQCFHAFARHRAVGGLVTVRPLVCVGRCAGHRDGKTSF